MNVIRDILDLLAKLLSWWFVVLPWEQAVRVRAGSHKRLYNAGLHFKVPFLDYVWTQNTRRRASSVEAQTLSTKDGKTITLAGSLAYRVEDVMLLQVSLHQAAATLGQMVAGACSSFVITHDFSDCTPNAIVQAVNAAITEEFSRVGLRDVRYFLTDFVTTDRTYRLVQNGVGAPIYGTTLTTVNENIGAGVPAASGAGR